MSNKDNKPKNTKFNAYWIYGIAIVLFLVFNVFSGGLGNSTGVSTTPSQFFKFLRNGDVKKVKSLTKEKLWFI